MNKKSSEEKKYTVTWSWRKTVAVVSGLVFIPALIVFFMTLVLKQTVISPTYYKDNLKSVDAYTRIINQGIPSMIMEKQISDNALTDTLAKDISIVLLQKLIDPLWLEGLTDKVVDITVDFFTTKKTEIVLNLSEIKPYLVKVSGALLFAEQVIPPCPAKPIETPKVLEGSGIDLSQLCTSEGLNLDAIKTDLSGIRKEIDTVTVGVVKVDELITQMNSFITTIRSFVVNVNTYFTVSILVMLVLITVLVVVLWGRTYLMLEAISLMVGIGAFATLCVGFFSSLFVPKSLVTGSVFSSGMRTILDDFLYASVSGVFTRIELYAGITLLGAIGVYVLVFILKRKLR